MFLGSIQKSPPLYMHRNAFLAKGLHKLKEVALVSDFPPEIFEELGYYVYRLIDPRNGETFYVGKGKGNRVFAHALGEVDSDILTDKISRIREIRLAGFEVAHVIHRHGLDSKTALEVEAALIDAYPGLSNIAGGHNSNDRGVMHADEIIEKYHAEEAKFQHKALLISVNRSALESVSLYEATRYAWRLNKNKAEKADLVLSIVNGMIRGVFIPKKWLEATASNFPGRQDVFGRFGFVGYEAPAKISEIYLKRRIPEKYRKRGASNPVKYTW